MSYSPALRKCAVEYYLEGHSLRATKKIFGASPQTISNWVNQLKEEGTLENKPLKRTFRKIDPEKLKKFIADNPDAYLREIKEEFKCSESGIRKALKSLKITRKKKTTHYKEKDPEKVAKYEEEIRDIPKRLRAYVDEAGCDKYMFRPYARAPRGEKVHEDIQGRKFQRSSIVAAKVGHDIIAPLQFQGTMNGDFFEAWFENHLIPALAEDVVIIMDNASFHRKGKLRAIAEKHNRRIIFLPPYSPDLNPIEHFWQWLKKTLGDILQYFSTIEEAMSIALTMWGNTRVM